MQCQSGSASPGCSTSKYCEAAASRPAAGRGCVLPARRRPGRDVKLASFAGDVDVDLARLASQVVSTSLLALGAYMLSRTSQQQPEQDQLDNRNSCPRCSGTGYEACMCTRWSDGDAGCSACNNTAYTRCRACGGGGNAVPLLRRVEKYPNGGGNNRKPPSA